VDTLKTYLMITSLEEETLPEINTQTETSYIPGVNRQTITIRVKQFLSKSRPV
jgi:hypothetical protein